MLRSAETCIFSPGRILHLMYLLTIRMWIYRIFFRNRYYMLFILNYQVQCGAGARPKSFKVKIWSYQIFIVPSATEMDLYERLAVHLRHRKDFYQVLKNWQMIATPNQNSKFYRLKRRMCNFNIFEKKNSIGVSI